MHGTGRTSRGRGRWHERLARLTLVAALAACNAASSANEPLSVTRAGAGSGRVVSAPAGIDCGPACAASFERATSVALLAQPDPGSVFTGWSGACAGADVCALTMDSPKTVTASFSPAPTGVRRALTVTLGGEGAGLVGSTPAGIDCGATCRAEFAAGTVVRLAPVALPGSVFTGWSDDCAGLEVCTLTLNVARSALAYFAVIPTGVESLTVRRAGTGGGRVVSRPEGIDCGASCTAQFARRATVVLEAQPNAGSAFVGWSGACAGQGDCVLVMDGPKTVDASFDSTSLGEQVLTVSLTGDGDGRVLSTPAGIDCGTSCSAVFPYGTTVRLAPVALSGSVFAGWTGDCTGTDVCTLSINRAYAATASFVPSAPANLLPSLSAIRPTTVELGSTPTLVVSGTGFSPTSQVLLDGVPAPPTYVDPFTLTITLTSADTATGRAISIRVFNPPPGGGVSAAGGITVSNPLPNLSSLDVTAAFAGSAPFALTVDGSGFVPPSRVRWGAEGSGSDVELATTYVSPTRLLASITATQLATAGDFRVSVRTPSPGGGTSNNVAFRVRHPCAVPISPAGSADVGSVQVTNGLVAGTCEISLPSAFTRSVYDAASNTAYATDPAGKVLASIELATGKVTARTLAAAPGALCVRASRNRVYVVHPGTTFIGEYSLPELSLLRRIYWPAPVYGGSTDVYFRLHCGATRLYVLDAAWTPGLWTVEDADGCADPVDRSAKVNSVGDLAFTADESSFFYWMQYGWSAGLANSTVSRVDTAAWTIADRATGGSATNFNRDPLDTPTLLDPTRGLVLAKNRIFDATDLSRVLYTFTDPRDASYLAHHNLYALDAARGYVASRHDVFSLTTYASVATVASSAAKQYFFGSDGKLRMLLVGPNKLACQTIP